MTNVRPLNPTHSINEVVFVLQFSQELEERHLRLVSNLEESIRETLPRKEEVTAFAIEIKDNQLVSGPTPGPTLTEVKFSHHKEDGTTDWLLRLTRRFLAISCFEYDRWSEVWPKASGLMRLIGLKLIGENVALAALSLQYIDRFLYEGDRDAYSPDQLFDMSTPYLSPQILRAGPVWHLHQGWFEDIRHLPISREARVLNRLNINSAELEGEHQTTIDHQLSWQFREFVTNPRSVIDGNGDTLDYAMTRLHESNKGVLLGLLNRQMLSQIGMADEEGA